MLFFKKSELILLIQLEVKNISIKILIYSHFYYIFLYQLFLQNHQHTTIANSFWTAAQKKALTIVFDQIKLFFF